MKSIPTKARSTTTFRFIFVDSGKLKPSVRFLFTAILLMGFVGPATARQTQDPGQLGTWYAYSISKGFGESGLGMNAVALYRSWDYGSDMEQFIVRAAATYRPKKAKVTFASGYDYVANGAFGEETSTFVEHRLYQQAVLPHKVGSRFHFSHRLRYEQRWVEGQSFRTRYRYLIGLNIPLNKKELVKGAVYLRLFNEFFINGQRAIGNGRIVPYFDRDWYHAGLGYVISKSLRVQAGFMRHITNNWEKTQSLVTVLHRL
jgi:hypothetical protein